jgi:hypothetical protein
MTVPDSIFELAGPGVPGIGGSGSLDDEPIQDEVERVDA